MSNLKSKLPKVGTTIFTVMSQMAQEHKAINLSQGFPDFPIDDQLPELVNKYMLQGHNQYAPMTGSPQLREQISKTYNSKYNLNLHQDAEITITAGATEALFVAIQALVHPGEEVIVFDPAYDSYDPAIRLSGGIPIHLNLQFPNFNIDWQQVEDTISEKTRLIIINNPHNPTGSVLSRNDLLQLEALVKKHEQLFVLSDEVYEHITFDGKSHQSVLQFPALYEKSLVAFSFGKTFHITGWKVGYVIAPEYLSREIRKVHQYVTFSVNTPVQLALAEFLKDEKNYQGIDTMYQAKRDLFLKGTQNSRFEAIPASGTYFQLLSYKDISDKPDVEMAEWLTKTHGVASIPISVFSDSEQDNQVLRFCFAKNEETLKKATEILCKI
ncbi:methionine aminotransferase [Fulvivirga ligni]|uniref:methionine aminotransferase n=1 Tax=Fulvivirga ligni TaxID=2904246 RepID=UPI001F2AFC25|nr:methionine aminotransferase [Fulvivirga ligni]UII21958.1 methionine aminotransferase [Fulvivirga ligni]